jgi:lipopolysaccharide/colanic/teichoic acid biosynthesis glycosyltransferase
MVRDDISIEKKVALDKEYLEKRSFFFDLLIIGKTFSNVLFGLVLHIKLKLNF